MDGEAVNLLFGIAALLCLATGVIGTLVLVKVDQFLTRGVPWEEITTPVKPEVAQDMCQQLRIPREDRRCQAGAVVWAPDFFPEIRGLRAWVSSYDDIQARLGKYQYYCEAPVTSSSGTYVFCHYDLVGDRVFPFILSSTRVVSCSRFSRHLGVSLRGSGR